MSCLIVEWTNWHLSDSLRRAIDQHATEDNRVLVYCSNRAVVYLLPQGNGERTTYAFFSCLYSCLKEAFSTLKALPLVSSRLQAQLAFSWETASSQD